MYSSLAVLLVEDDPAFLETAKLMLRRIGFGRIEAVSDAETARERLAAQRYDLIVSNPPYVNADSMTKLPPEYRSEPQMALAGGEDGMDLVRRIVDGARSRLKPRGVLVVEVGNERAHAEAAFPELELTWLSTSAGDDMVFLLTAEQLGVR